MSSGFTINPDTKKRIKVGGPKYQELVAAGKIVPNGKKTGAKATVAKKETVATTKKASSSTKTVVSKKATPVVTITPFDTDNISYVVFSAPNLAITVKQAQELGKLKLDINANMELAFFNELHIDGVRPKDYSAYQPGRLTTTAPGRNATARRYEKIVEAARGVDQPQIGALGFRLSPENAEQAAKQISELLGLKQLQSPMMGEGTAEYDGLRILYRVYQAIPQSYHDQQLTAAKEQQEKEERGNEENRLKSEQMKLAKKLNDLQDAHEVWKASKDKKKTKDMIERIFHDRWPDYTYNGVSIFDTLQEFQNDADKEGIDRFIDIPLYYDLQDDELIYGVRDDWDEGGEDEEYKEIQKYEDGDRVLVLYAK